MPTHLNKQSITAIIPVRNEEENITRCLESLKWCDKILVLFSGEDKTGQIAKKMGAEVIRYQSSGRDDFQKLQKNINQAIQNVKTDWILRIDADEVVELKLQSEIKQILNNPEEKIVAYGIPRKQFFLGGFLKGGDWAYDKLVRLFKKGSASYDEKKHVHEQSVVTGEIGYLKNALIHYSHPNLETAVRKFNSYTSSQISDLTDTYPLAVLKMVFLPPYIFLRWTFWHLGIRDGLRGIVAGIMRAWYEFILYAKYIEMKYIRK